MTLCEVDNKGVEGIESNYNKNDMNPNLAVKVIHKD